MTEPTPYPALTVSGSRLTVSDFHRVRDDLRLHAGSNQLAACIWFRKCLSIESNPYIQEVVDSGVIPDFVSFLHGSEANLVFEAAWCLTNICSGTTVHVRAVVEQGAVPELIKLLHSPHVQTVEQVAWCLGNIAGDSPDCRDLCLSHGTLEAMMKCCPKSTVYPISCRRTCTWALSNLCRGKPAPDFDSVRACVPTFVELISDVSEDSEVLVDALWALSYLTTDDSAGNIRIQGALDAGVATPLVKMIQVHAANVKIVTPTLRTIGNIATGNDSQTEQIVARGAVRHFAKLITHTNKSIKKEAFWTLSNITAGTRSHIQSVFDADLIEPTLETLLSAHEAFEVKKEALWVIGNALSGGSASQVHSLVSLGCLRAISVCTSSNKSDTRFLSVALQSFESALIMGAREELKALGPLTGTASMSDISDPTEGGGVVSSSDENAFATVFEESGALSLIEELQTHPSGEIYEKALSLLETHFQTDVVEPGIEGGLEGEEEVPGAGAA